LKVLLYFLCASHGYIKPSEKIQRAEQVKRKNDARAHNAPHPVRPSKKPKGKNMKKHQV
jgi:hypothetical protein